MKTAITALLLLGASMPAQAATYLFTFDSVADQDYSFTLDSSPVVDDFALHNYFRVDIWGFYNEISGGGFDDYFSDQVYTGPENAPTFKLGAFNQFFTLSHETLAGTLTISESGVGGVPEPASWALMLTGFGAVGGALRNRRKLVVSFG